MSSVPARQPGAIDAPGLDAALAAVSTDRMQATVEILAADRFTGRRVGTPGSALAVDWLAGHLRELGAETRIERFPVTGVQELDRTPVLELSTDGTTRKLEHRREFAEHRASAGLPHPRTGPVAKASAASLHGRWVLVPDGWSVAELDQRPEMGAAAGLLIPRGTDPAGWMPKMISGPTPSSLPIIGIRNDIHEWLATRENALVTASMPLRLADVTGANVHGEFFAGDGGTRLLLTAHHDGVGDDPGVRLPAAADNASGVAVVLEAARILVRARNEALNLMVTFPDAEEAGAVGSAHHAPSVPLGTMVINIDGAAQLRESAAVEASGSAHAMLAVLDQAGRHVGMPLRGGRMPSDNRRYAAAGLPAIGIGAGIPGYQTPAETPDRVEPGTMLATARLLVATAWLLARSQTDA